jgi:chromosome segregation ATPase
VASFGALAETPDLALLGRLRDVLGDRPVTETELRRSIEQAEGLVRSLGAQIAGSESRLAELTDDPDSSLTEIATELQRVEALRPRLEEARSLLAGLETRAREVRSAWLLRQAEGPLTR